MSKTYKKRKQKAGNATVLVRNRNSHTNGIGKPTKTVRLHKTPKDITRPSLKCSPFAKKNKVVSNSCFTKEAVQEMVHTFNNSHPNIPISNTTSTINQYHELNKKAEKCDQKDSCLLDSLPLDESKKPNGENNCLFRRNRVIGIKIPMLGCRISISPKY